MARRIAFNYTQALDRATTLFWQHGYTETGLRELLKTMEIGEGSFYNTLKSKKHLYLSCVEHYGETVVRRRLEALAQAATAAEGIRAFFRVSLDCLDAPDTPSRLCLVAAMVSEQVLAEPELRECVQGELEKVRGFSWHAWNRIASAGCCRLHWTRRSRRRSSPPTCRVSGAWRWSATIGPHSSDRSTPS